MMTELYDEKERNEMLSQRKRALVFGGIACALCLVLPVLSCFFADENNVLYWKIADAVWCVAASWCALYLLLGVAGKCKARLSHLAKMTGGKTERTEIFAVGNKITVSRDLVVREIFVESGDRVLYVEEGKAFPFRAGDALTCRTAANFIVAYEAE